MSKYSIVCAGIDTSKDKLDVAVTGVCAQLQVKNAADGYAALSAWLRKHKVERVGIEATGGYEQAVVAHLRRDGFVVIVLQPAQVHAFRKFQLQWAKNDRIDAILIAAVTAAIETVRLPPDPRLVSFAAELTVIEQITEDIARLKTRRAAGSCDERSRAFWKDEIARLKRLERTLLKALEAAIRAHDDLARLFDLINSVDGVGQRTALSILIRMPEIGLVTRNVAAALVGVAPYDADSGTHVGERHIAGGRQRLRKALYAAALPAAFRWNAQLKVFYRRLTAAGKSHKEALVACARKLIIYVNTVVARGTPWQAQPAPTKPDLCRQAT